MKNRQVPSDQKLTALDEFKDALDRSIEHLSMSELEQYRKISRDLYFKWLTMASYGWTFEQSCEYLDSGICQYN